MKPPRLTNHQKMIRILLLSGVVILVTGYFTYPESPRDAGKTAKFAYCRYCEKETSHVPGKDLNPCLKCGRETVGIADSIKKIGKPKNPYLPTIIACSCEAILAMGVLYYFTKPPANPTDEQEDYLVMRCPHCARKLKFRESQQGNLGQCPLCKKPLKFPVQTSQESV